MSITKKDQKIEQALFERRLRLGERIAAAKKELAQAWDEVRILDAESKYHWKATHPSALQTGN